MSSRRTVALYLAAAAVYITVGAFFPAFLYSSAVAIAYVLVAVWLLPALVRRLR
jgi:hypothetical protein